MKAGGSVYIISRIIDQKLGDLREGFSEALEFMKGNRGTFAVGAGGCPGRPGGNNGGGVKDSTADDGDAEIVQNDGEAGTPDADATTPTCSDYYGTQSVRQSIGVMDHYVKAPAHDPAGFSKRGTYLYWVNKNYDMQGSSPILDNKVMKLNLDEQSLQMEEVGQVDTSRSISQELSTTFARSIAAFNFQPQAGTSRDVVAVGVNALGQNDPTFEAGGLFLFDGTKTEFVRLLYSFVAGVTDTYYLKNINSLVSAGGMVCATHDLEAQPGVQEQHIPCQRVLEDADGKATFDTNSDPARRDVTPILVISQGQNTAGVAKIDETTVAVVRRGVANDPVNRPRIVFWNTSNVDQGYISLNEGEDIEISATHVPAGWTLVNLQRLAKGKTAKYFAVAATDGSNQKIVLINSVTDQQTSIDISDKVSGRVSGIVIDETNHRLYVTESGDETSGTPGNLIVIDFHQDTGTMSYATKSPSTSGDAGAPQEGTFEGALPIGTGLRLASVDHDSGKFYLFYMKNVLADKPPECRNGGIPVDDKPGFGKFDMASFQLGIPRN